MCAHARACLPQVVKRSSKIISFYDLAGHEKYLKTTIFGLSCSQPDACLIMVGGNRGVLRMTLEHMFLCKTLNIPFGIVVTKVDMMKDKLNVLEETLNSITALLKKPGMKRHPVKVSNYLPTYFDLASAPPCQGRDKRADIHP